MFNPTRLPIKPRFFAKILESILGLSALGNIYDGRPSNTSAKEFLRYTLRALGVSNVIQQEQNLEGIPRHGPVLIVANHPLEVQRPFDPGSSRSLFIKVAIEWVT